MHPALGGMRFAEGAPAFRAALHNAELQTEFGRGWKFTLRVRDEIQAEELKYLGVLFTPKGTMGKRIGPTSVVTLYRSVVVKEELSQSAKLPIYRSIYVPTLVLGQEL